MTDLNKEQRAGKLYAEAQELPEAVRDAFLSSVCGEDAELRLEVQRLLVQGAEADEFFGETEMATLPDGATLTEVEAGCGDAGSEAIGEKAGDVIGPYTLLEPLGEGGMGTVWKAQQKEPIHRQVALKVVKAGMDTKEVLARFEAERQALAMMDHPGIAKVLDAGATPNGRPYFAMELVDGVPITEYCREQALGTRARLELFRGVCGAINHAHQKGIIHRDLKPSNVMVTLVEDPIVRGPEHPDTLGNMTNLAYTYFRAGRRDEAIALQEIALASKRRVLPGGHRYITVALGNLARFYEDTGRQEEARPLRQELANLTAAKPAVLPAEEREAFMAES